MEGFRVGFRCPRRQPVASLTAPALHSLDMRVHICHKVSIPIAISTSVWRGQGLFRCTSEGFILDTIQTERFSPVRIVKTSHLCHTARGLSCARRVTRKDTVAPRKRRLTSTAQHNTARSSLQRSDATDSDPPGDDLTDAREARGWDKLVVRPQLRQVRRPTCTAQQEALPLQRSDATGL